MEVLEKETPIKLNWTGEELDAVIKMCQIFPLALNAQNIEISPDATIQKHWGWTSEVMLKKLWRYYGFPISDINRARTALGRFALLKSRQRGQKKSGGFGSIFIFVDVDSIQELLTERGIEVPEPEKLDWDLIEPLQDIMDEKSASDKVDLSAFYENGLDKLDRLIPDDLPGEETLSPSLFDTVEPEPEPEKEKVPKSISSKVHKLLQEKKLLNEHKLLIVLWKLGNGGPVSRKRLRDSMGLQLAELALRGSAFINAVDRAANKGIVRLEGESKKYNSQLITPLYNLDYLIDFYKERRKKEEAKSNPQRELPVPPDKDNSQILELRQRELTGAQKVLLVIWMFGGEDVEMWALRETALKLGIFGRRNAFAVSFRAAERKGLIFVNGKGETATIRPIVNLDILALEIMTPKTSKRKREPMRPKSVSSKVQALLKDKSLTDIEKLLVFLWQFGPRGTERWNLRAIIKEDGEKVGLDFARFGILVKSAARNGTRRSALLEVIPGDSLDKDVIRPLLRLEDLRAGKHVIRKSKPPKVKRKGRGLTQKEQLLVILIKFGKRGSRRDVLRKRFELVSGKLGLRFSFPLILRQAHISHLLEITRSTKYSNDFIVPLVTLAELKRKYKGNQKALGQISQITSII